MDSPPFFTFFFLSSFLLLHTAGAADHPPISPPPVTGGANTADLDFLRRSCNTTLYPALCFHSLSRYAAAVGQSPGQLALAAVRVSLSSTRRAAAYFSNLTHSSDVSSDRRAAAALRDCASTFSDAADQMRGSLRQLQELGSAGSGAEELRFQLSNVQTWMSAAMTYEDTCTDGFDGVSAGRLKNDVCDRVVKVSQLTSNALAFVNCYASTVN